MKRTVKKSTRVDNNYPMCEICKNSRGCRIDPPMCDYDITDREDLKNRIFYAVTMNTKGDKETYPDDVVKEMNSRFMKIYNGKSFEIYNMNFDHEVCQSCDGSGVILNGDGIFPCKRCGGSGIRKIPIKDGFIKAYMLYNTDRSGFRVSEVLSICKTRKIAETICSQFFGSTDYENHIGEIFLSKHLDNDKMWSSFYNMFTDSYNPNTVTVFDTYKNQVVYAGITWKQFWHEGYATNLIGASEEYYDLDAMTNGRYIMIPTEEFNKNYQIFDSEFADELYTSELVNIIDNYLEFVTYGPDAYDLVNNYMSKYVEIRTIRDNLMTHIRNEDISKTGYVVADTDIIKLDKIIKDFKLIGMNIDRVEAATTVKLVQQLVPDVSQIIDGFNMVAIFLTEYIIISAEYANITD